jgi:xanthosine utilization system XapX-like protein
LKKSRIVALAVTTFVAGLFIGIISALPLQQSQIPSFVWLVLSGIAGVAIGQAVGVVDLIRSYFKDREERQSRPQFEITARIWTKDHPLHYAHENIRVLTLKVTNNGGGKDAEGVVSKIIIDGIIEYDVTLHWLIRKKPDIYIIPKIDAPFLQKQYLVVSYDTVPSIRHGDHEDVDVLFTTPQHDEAYVLDVDCHTLKFGQYNVTVKVMAKDLKVERVKFKVDIFSWNNIHVSGIPVA